MYNNNKSHRRPHANRALLAWAVVTALLLSSCGAGQSRIFHVGILSGSEEVAAIIDGFKARMDDLGYDEGRDIVYSIQSLTDDREGEKRAAQQFADDGVDLIFAFPTEAAMAAKAATEGSDIPVVFAYAGLEGADLVDSLDAPGGNLSGTRFPGPDLAVQRFEFLRKIDPSIQRLYVPFDRNDLTCLPTLAALQTAAGSAGVELIELPVATLDELQADLLAREASHEIGMDAIQLLPDLLLQSPDGWALVSGFAAGHNLPLVGGREHTVVEGGLLSYDVNPFDAGLMAATIADQVLQGTPAGTIPVNTPDAYLRINSSVARKLGLTVPESLLLMASEVVH
jgi:putative ABC transport system substrate-binding protein